jgi:hypothetical protein
MLWFRIAGDRKSLASDDILWERSGFFREENELLVVGRIWGLKTSSLHDILERVIGSHSLSNFIEAYDPFWRFGRPKYLSLRLVHWIRRFAYLIWPKLSVHPIPWVLKPNLHTQLEFERLKSHCGGTGLHYSLFFWEFEISLAVEISFPISLVE